MDCNKPPQVHIPTSPALIDHCHNRFYVHPSENYALPLVDSVLDGKNYHFWSCSMKKVIIMKNKIRFLDGSFPIPNDFDPTY
ncbi:hypothetical protein A2U01_0004567 [Trifolium medium]|uniref:Retrotransposon Copia-like N-terminal domain-containing protein n=1 Tax=Trifolium medium TaxID=97028 RepID=A0A392M8Y7_9FABA|nr:hypothetical protein [Trifolium medium]